MKKIIRKGAVLLVLFVVVVAGSALLMNSQSTDNRSDMNDATLPEVMVKIGSTQANKMYGYKQVMQTDFMRGSITPLDTTKKLTFEINPYSDSVTGPYPMKYVLLTAARSWKTGRSKSYQRRKWLFKCRD